MAKEKNIQNYTAADIEKYWKGELSITEMHAMEKAAMDDPFLADAMEGYRLTQNPGSEITALHSMLAQRTSSNIPINKPAFSLLKVAAAVVIVATLGYFGSQMLKRNDDQSMVFKEEITKTPETSPDTAIQILITPTDSQQFSRSIQSGTANFPLSVDTNRTIKRDDAAIYMNTDRDLAKQSEAAAATQDKEIKDVPPASVFTNTDTVSQIRPETQYKSNEVASAKNQDVADNSAKKMKSANKADGLEYFSSFGNSYVGQVIDAKNNPVPFANITNLRDRVGTYSDMKGNFNLISPDTVLNLQVRSVGYQTRNYRVPATPGPKKLVLQQDALAMGNASSSPAARVRLNQQQQLDTASLAENEIEDIEPTIGWDYYNTYITNNIQLPATKSTKNAREVELTFQVDKSGTPTNIRISRSSKCKECDQAAIKVLKEGPKWTPTSMKRRGSIVIAID